MTLTGKHFAREKVLSGALSVFEASRRVANAGDSLVRFAATPPAVGRRIPVEPVCRAASRRRLLVQPEPVVFFFVTVDTGV